MSDTNNPTAPELSAFDAKAAFMQDTANELLNIDLPVATDDAEKPSEEAAPAEDVVETPEVETEATVEEDSEEDILADLLGEDDDEGDSDSAEESEESIPDNTVHKVKVDGEELEVTTDELIKAYGRSKALTQKEQSVAEERARLEELENTIQHLQYQGEFQPRYYEHSAQMKKLNEAKDALAEGQAYNGISGDKLAAQIQTAQVILDKNKAALDNEYREAVQGVDAPGRKALEARLPDIAEKFNDYAKGWSEIGSKFGFTSVELANNSDFRFYNMAQEIIEKTEKLEALEAKIEKVRAKRRGGKVASSSSPKKAASGSRRKADASKPTTQELHERISAGDGSARAAIVNDIFGDL